MDPTTTPADIKRQLQDLITGLDDLGTADAIADELRALGVKGSHRSCNTCPIAVYLAVKLPAGNVDVTRGQITYRPIGGGAKVRASVRPGPLRDFIDYFDSKRIYLDLAGMPA